MSVVQVSLSYLTLFVNIVWIVGLLAYVLKKSPLEINFLNELYLRVSETLKKYYAELSLVLVFVATTGSLYFSKVLGWDPCIMCWYQRILMYPLVVIFGVGVLLEKDDIEDYAMPLALIGSGMSFYHYLVQRIEQFQSAGCSIAQVSCETQYTYYFDYITVPMMAFTVFLTVLLLNWRFSE